MARALIYRITPAQYTGTIARYQNMYPTADGRIVAGYGLEQIAELADVVWADQRFYFFVGEDSYGIYDSAEEDWISVEKRTGRVTGQIGSERIDHTGKPLTQDYELLVLPGVGVLPQPKSLLLSVEFSNVNGPKFAPGGPPPSDTAWVGTAGYYYAAPPAVFIRNNRVAFVATTDTTTTPSPNDADLPSGYGVLTVVVHMFAEADNGEVWVGSYFTYIALPTGSGGAFRLLLPSSAQGRVWIRDAFVGVRKGEERITVVISDVPPYSSPTASKTTAGIFPTSPYAHRYLSRATYIPQYPPPQLHASWWYNPLGLSLGVSTLHPVTASKSRIIFSEAGVFGPGHTGYIDVGHTINALVPVSGALYALGPNHSSYISGDLASAQTTYVDILPPAMGCDLFQEGFVDPPVCNVGGSVVARWGNAVHLTRGGTAQQISSPIDPLEDITGMGFFPEASSVIVKVTGMESPRYWAFYMPTGQWVYLGE